MSDLKDFLESIRKHSDKIGETAMKQVRFGGVWGRLGESPAFGKGSEIRRVEILLFQAKAVN